MPYDGIDQDCSGTDEVDLDNDGYAGGGGPDCNDARPDINPGEVDVCSDGVDQDCSGADTLCDEDIFVVGALFGGGFDPIGTADHLDEFRNVVKYYYAPVPTEFRYVPAITLEALEDVDLFFFWPAHFDDTTAGA